jgi:hypothetical protein
MTFTLAETDAGPGDRAGRLRMTPGRVVALMIGVPVALALIGWTGFTIVAALGQASFQVRDSIPVIDNQVSAQIEGNLTLRQAPVSTAQLTGTAHYSLFRPPLTKTLTATAAGVGYNCTFTVGNCGLNGSLVVPPRAALSLNTLGGDLSVARFTGNLTLDTAGGNLNAGTLTTGKPDGGVLRVDSSGGDVTANSLEGPVQMQTGGGNVNVNSVVATDATIQTAGGDVTMGFTGVQTDQTISSGGGNVTVSSAVAADANVQSDGGDVTMTFTKAPTSLTVESGGGNVMLVLPPGQYNFQYNAGGGNSSVPASDTSSRNVVTVHSDGGDITITEAS